MQTQQIETERPKEKSMKALKDKFSSNKISNSKVINKDILREQRRVLLFTASSVFLPDSDWPFSIKTREIDASARLIIDGTESIVWGMTGQFFLYVLHGRGF